MTRPSTTIVESADSCDWRDAARRVLAEPAAEAHDAEPEPGRDLGGRDGGLVAVGPAGTRERGDDLRGHTLSITN